MKAMSLFACSGVGETYLEEIGVNVVIANELLKDRAEIYKYRFPKTEMIVGDIKDKKEELISKAKSAGIELLLATPPCQGMSNIGKRDYQGDERNYLIFDVFDIIDQIKPKYILIENVPKFLDMYYPYKGEIKSLKEILDIKYSEYYEIIPGVFNAKDYGVPQSRKRAILRLCKKGLKWNDPPKEKEITLREAIGYLPSIESGEKTDIKWHWGPKHSDRHIEWLKHTPSGQSAFDNEVYYPKRKDGQRISGYHNTYRRLDWDKPCPTRTMKSGSVSGSNNCHPGRLQSDGTYSDARCLSLLELFIVSSLPKDLDLPDGISENLIRDIVGEGVPPRMLEAFIKEIV